MTESRKIGFIGGGNMAGALVRGLLSRGVAQPSDIRVSDPLEARRAELEAEYRIVTSPDNREVAAFADVVVLATKPLAIPTILPEVASAMMPGKLVVSIAAGVPLATIEGALPRGTRVVRAMPNTPALVGAGATAVAFGNATNEGDIAFAKLLFDAVGTTVVVGEALMDGVTGLSGSGPAYVFQFIEALADGGVRVGLPRAIALELAAETVRGAAALYLDTRTHPGELKDMVTSPGGTTIAGVHALERGGFRGVVMDAVEAATERSVQLGAAASKR